MKILDSRLRGNDSNMVFLTFYETIKSKRRPALVILDIGDQDVVLAPITTKKRFGKGDCQLGDWQVSGLLRESWVRLAKVACLNKKEIVRRLGVLTSHDLKMVSNAWQALYGYLSGL